MIADGPIVVPPPRPAPYLASVPPLSDRVRILLMATRRLTLEEKADIDRELRDRRRWLRASRTAYESSNGVRIAPELPAESA
jgi:hypothetical protein